MKTRNKRKKVQKRIQKGGNLWIRIKRLYARLTQGELDPDEFFEQARKMLQEDAIMKADNEIKRAEAAIKRTRKKCDIAERRHATLLEKVERERAQNLESAINYGTNYKNLDRESIEEEIGRIIGEIPDEADIVSVVNPYLFDTGEFAAKPNFHWLERMFGRR